MVFFTCNNCGESLKKKDVEKHNNTRCRGGPFLTCVDCLKDFREDYVKHTLCVSEDDRYGSMGLKGLQSKQKSKQQIWVETVQDCVSRAIDGGDSGLTPSMRSLLLYLQDQPTLPDKQKTFSNFIKNARRAEPIQNIEYVWKILEQGRNDMQAKLKAEREAAEAVKKLAKQQQMKESKKASSSSGSDDSDSSDSEGENKSKNGAKAAIQSEKLEAEADDTVTHMNGKKDKKKKRMVSESDSVTNGTSQKTKKAKKNPASEEGGSTSNLNNALNACHLDADANNDDQKLSKKEKKEKKKRGKYEAELKEMETVNNDEEVEVDAEQTEEVEETKESKKDKKKKGKKDKEVIEDEEPINTGERKKKDKKNKKRLLSGAEEDAEQFNAKPLDKKKVKNAKSDHCQLNEDLNTEQTDNVKFTWDAAILQVLESQGDKEISLKRLSKKVVNEYLMSVGENTHIDEMKIMNKFHKRLEKMHNVLVHKDKVRLKTSSD